MKKILSYIKLMRPKHYIKNALIFLPLFFSGQITNVNLLIKCIIAFVSFSLCASSIYIINDIKDVEKDRLHPKKRLRPIASGDVSKVEAIVLFVSVVIFSIISNALTGQPLNFMATWLPYLCYFFVNIFYCFKGKNIPIMDIAILASCYYLRVWYGASITGIAISDWLYLSIISVAFYLGLGKRRNEIEKMDKDKNTRKVLEYYNKSFLNNNMYMILGLGIVFYSLWCIQTNMLITVPLVIVLCMKYSLIIEGDSDGDPVDAMLSDKVFLLLGLLLAVIMGWKLYFS